MSPFTGGGSFRPMVRSLSQTAAPLPTPPAPSVPVAPSVPAGPVVVPIAPAPTPVVVAEQQPATNYGPLLTVAAIAAGITAVILLTKESKEPQGFLRY